MELQFYGANCIRIVTKKAAVIVDDNLVSLGLKSVTKPNDLALYTTRVTDSPNAQIVIDSAGEYEASGVSIQGIAARAHMDEEGKFTATMFKLDVDDIRVAIVGHVHPDLTDDELEELGIVDVLIIPVGGSGYTLDPIGALKVIKAIEPKIIVPAHYADKAINYEVPQASLEEALKGLGMEISVTVSKLKLKPAELPEVMKLVVLERQ